jgi:AraC-like DNA-binding protein
LTPDTGDGYWELTRIRGEIYVSARNCIYKDLCIEVLPADDLIHFNFQVSGDVRLAVSHTEALRFNRPCLLVWAQSQAEEILAWTAPGARERSVVISVRPDFLIEYLGTPMVDMPPSLRALMAEPRGRLNYCQFSLTAQMVNVATRLIKNPTDGTLALLHTEALVLELLCAAVGSMSALPALPGNYSERELRCLQATHELLIRQFAPVPTIRKLARSMGMAETTLTTGFKALYGETIVECSLRCRMQHAITLLRDQRWSVDKVSEAVGYSHPTSFATAFRRHFGIRPIDVRGVRYGPRRPAE